MTIDLDRVVGAQLAPTTASWDEDAVILYHLGIGAGADPVDPNELEYTYEANLKVLPSFASVASFSMLVNLLGVDGLEFNPAMMLHGEQAVSVRRPLPRTGSVTNRGTITDVYDKGRGATVIVDVDSVDGEGVTVFTSRATLFLRGEGGFGGSPGPAPRHEAPERAPDHVVESPTLPQQALLYRLNGDRNPLHADPAFAAFGGFDRPILHGLCSYGMVCKAVVDRVFDGDVAAIDWFEARFAGSVVPGETIVTSMWDEGDSIVLAATTKGRGTPVITNAAVGRSEG
jgi:acyl dehydratase